VQNIIQQANITNITFVEQKERRGTGHAVVMGICNSAIALIGYSTIA